MVAQCTGDQLGSTPLGLRLQILVQREVKAPDSRFLIISKRNALAGRFESLLLQLQIAGVLIVGGFTFVVSWIVWTVLKLTMGIRVSEEEELAGLDNAELGMEAYPEFARQV